MPLVTTKLPLVPEGIIVGAMSGRRWGQFFVAVGTSVELLGVDASPEATHLVRTPCATIETKAHTIRRTVAIIGACRGSEVLATVDPVSRSPQLWIRCNVRTAAEHLLAN